MIDALYQQYAAAKPEHRLGVVQEQLHTSMKWCVAHPVNDLASPEAVHTEFLAPLLQALPDVERRPQIRMQGGYEGRHWINSTGYFVGTFEKALLGIPATGKVLYLRYTEMVCIEQGQILSLIHI